MIFFYIGLIVCLNPNSNYIIESLVKPHKRLSLLKLIVRFRDQGDIEELNAKNLLDIDKFVFIPNITDVENEYRIMTRNQYLVRKSVGTKDIVGSYLKKTDIDIWEVKNIYDDVYTISQGDNCLTGGFIDFSIKGEYAKIEKCNRNHNQFFKLKEAITEQQKIKTEFKTCNSNNDTNFKSWELEKKFAILDLKKTHENISVLEISVEQKRKIFEIILHKLKQFLAKMHST